MTLDDDGDDDELRIRRRSGRVVIRVECGGTMKREA
jgi:hypothetical protein